MEESADIQARKRPSEDTTGGGSQTKRQAVHGEFGSSGEDTMTVRILLPSQVVGCLIGKGGATAKQIREESGVRMQISEQQPDVAERMLSLTGTLPVLSASFGLITKRLADEGERFGQSHAVSFKVVVPTPQIGALIGKAGATVKEMREQSHTSIQVSPPADFPERIVTINGSPEAVAHALFLVSERLFQNPLRGPVSGGSSFGGGYGGGRSGQSGGYAGGAGGYGGGAGGFGGGYGGYAGGQGGYQGSNMQRGPPAASPRGGPMSFAGRLPTSPGPQFQQAAFPPQMQQAQSLLPPPQASQQQQYGYAAAPSGMMAPSSGYAQPAPQQPMLSPMSQQQPQQQAWDGGYSGGYSGGYGGQPQAQAAAQLPAAAAAPSAGSQQVTLPNDMVGHIIGKGGSRINQIRQLSGAQIKIADMQPGAVARLITLSGTPEQIQAAQYYINSALESANSGSAAF